MRKLVLVDAGRRLDDDDVGTLEGWRAR